MLCWFWLVFRTCAQTETGLWYSFIYTILNAYMNTHVYSDEYAYNIIDRRTDRQNVKWHCVRNAIYYSWHSIRIGCIPKVRKAESITSEQRRGEEPPKRCSSRPASETFLSGAEAADAAAASAWPSLGQTRLCILSIAHKLNLEDLNLDTPEAQPANRCLSDFICKYSEWEVKREQVWTQGTSRTMPLLGRVHQPGTPREPLILWSRTGRPRGKQRPRWRRRSGVGEGGGGSVPSLRLARSREEVGREKKEDRMREERGKNAGGSWVHQGW